MSQRAIVLSVRDYIRTLLDLSPAPEICDVTFGGQPHPACGQEFVAVHEFGWDGSNTGDYDLWENFGCQVTITRRTPEAPQDRQATALWWGEGEDNGTHKKVRAILVALHKSYGWQAIANEKYLDKDSPWSGGFHKPLVFAGGTDLIPRGAAWFGAAPGTKMAGISQTLRFTSAERGQDRAQEEMD